jgi:hypothetical protein
MRRRHNIEIQPYGEMEGHDEQRRDELGCLFRRRVVGAPEDGGQDEREISVSIEALLLASTTIPDSTPEPPPSHPASPIPVSATKKRVDERTRTADPLIDVELHRPIEALHYATDRCGTRRSLSGVADCAKRDFERSTFVQDQGDPEALARCMVCVREGTPWR